MTAAALRTGYVDGMQRILSRARRIEPKQAALFVVAAGAVAAIVYFAGREAQVEQRIEASAPVTQERTAEPIQQDDEEAGEATAEPLTLTLSAPRICEAQHPRGGSAGAIGWWYWGAEGTEEVAWQTSGGDAPYTVTIAGETHTGASGTAEVSCALQHGPTINRPEHGRTYADDDKPVVDSGLKTISATAADSTGATAEATADVYVILVLEDSDHVMKSGETYRVRGWLVTVPDGVDIDDHRVIETSVCENTREDGTVIESIICETIFSLAWHGEGYWAHLGVGMRTGKERGRAIWLDDQDAVGAGHLYREVNAKLSDLAASIGQPPQLDDH